MGKAMERIATRQRRKRSTVGKPQGAGGGMLRDFHRYYRIPRDGDPKLPFSILKADYITRVSTENGIVEERNPYAVKSQHYIPSISKGSPFLNCSAGIKEFIEDGQTNLIPGDGKCVGCQQAIISQVNKNNGDIDEEERILTVNKASVTRIYSALILAWYHRVDTGKKNRRGYKIYDRELCKGASCPLCGDDSIETYFGQPVYLSLGRTQAERLDEIELFDIESMCECGGKIETVGFVCPACEHAEEVDWELLDGHERNEFLFKKIKCRKCKEHVRFTEQIACINCEDTSPLSIHDLVLWMDGGNKNAPTLSLTRAVKINDFFGQMKKKGKLTEENIKEARSLFTNFADLSKIHPILDLDSQARFLGVANPYYEDNPDEYEEYGPSKHKRTVQRADDYRKAADKPPIVQRRPPVDVVAGPPVTQKKHSKKAHSTKAPQTFDDMWKEIDSAVDSNNTFTDDDIPF